MPTRAVAVEPDVDKEADRNHRAQKRRRNCLRSRERGPVCGEVRSLLAQLASDLVCIDSCIYPVQQLVECLLVA